MLPKPFERPRSFSVATSQHGNSSADLIWVVSDRSGIRQQLAQTLGFASQSFVFDLHSQSHFAAMRAQLEAQKPWLLWVRLHGPAMRSGNRRDDRRAQFLQRLIRMQVDAKRIAILDGNLRSEGWNLQAVKELSAVMHEALHRWCRHQSLHEDACSVTTRIWCSVELTSLLTCTCAAHRRHFTLKHFALDHARNHIQGVRFASSTPSQSTQNEDWRHGACHQQEGQPTLRDSAAQSTLAFPTEQAEKQKARKRAGIAVQKKLRSWNSMSMMLGMI